MEQSADERAAASATESSDETATKLQTLQNIYSDDLVTFRRDSSKRRSFNRETYSRLQNSIRGDTSQNSVSALKNRFESKLNESDKVKTEKFKTAITVNLTINEDKKPGNPVEKQKIIVAEVIDKIDEKKVKVDKKEVIAKEDKVDEEQITVNKELITIDEKGIKVDEKKVKPPVPTKPTELQSKLKPATLRRHRVDDSPKSTLQKRVSFSNDISRIPIPAPRKSLQAKSEPELRAQFEVIKVELLNIAKEQVTPVIILPKKKKSDENSNYLEKSHRRDKPKPQNFDFDKIEFAEPEDKHIIARGSSEDSIDKIESDLGLFEMEGKKKKRSNSFKKILTGGFFNKKKEDDKKKTKKTENAIFADNVQNETSNHGQYSKMHAHNMAQQHKCQTQQRLQQPSDLEARYAQMHINRFNHAKQTFNQPPENVITEDYVCMDSRVQNQNKYMQHKYETNTSSSSNTLDSENLAFDSQRTRDSDHSSSSNQEKPLNTNTVLRNKFFERSYETQETPPRAFDTYQNVQLVTPKALIPINSERPLPNPYQDKPTLKTIDRNLNSPNTKETPIKPNMYKNEFNDGVYGTVYDRKLISNPSPVRSHSSESSIHSNNQNLSRSPSLEGSKLKLPANREKIELQPRIKSPIPPNAISTDKIIATELLKSKKDDKNWSPSHQRLEIDIDYPDSSIPPPRYDQNMETNLRSKPPISPQNKIIQNLEAAEWHKKQREISRSPSLYTPNSQVTTNVMVHVDSHSPQNRCVTPNADLRSRSNTPNTLRSPSAQRSPPKHEIRQTVEAFCWKELKKMKEQEDRQIQMQIQFTPFGCAEEPVISHRSRSMSPNFVRNTRRSSSLPREVLRQRRLEEDGVRRLPQRPNEQIYGQNKVQSQNFVRNSPQRSTIGSTNVGRNGYDDPSFRPIFKRGSLTQQFNSMEPQALYNKKVSFHNTQNPAWPTRNGFTQSPPQRRIEMKRDISADDEVFLPNDPNGNEAMYGSRPSNEPIYGGKPINEPIYGGKLVSEPIYGGKPTNEPIYGGKPVNEPIYGGKPGERTYGGKPVSEPIYGGKPGEIIYGGKSSNEPQYVTKSNQRLTREEIFYINQQRQKQIKEATEVDRQKGNFDFRPLPNEPIYGGKQNGDYMYANKIREPVYGSKMPNINENEPIYNTRYNEPVYITRQSTPIYEQQPIYGQRNQPMQERNQSFQEPLYDRNRRTTVNNKVCDMYGRIHDGSNPRITSPPPQQKSGVLYGQLQRNSNAAPIQYQSYNQIQNPNFVRGTRLTASVNDMYRRGPSDPRYQQEFEPPNRPLPPLPPDGRMRAFMRRQGSNASDTESNASEIQRFFPRDQHPMKNRIVGK